MKPNQIMLLDNPKWRTNNSKRVVEIISHPYMENGEEYVQIRLTPNQPTTCINHLVNGLRPFEYKHKRLYIHYARVWGTLSFPLDMLRYDSCQTLNNVVWEDDSLDSECPLSFDEPVIVAQIGRYPKHFYHPDRWQSFGWICKPLHKDVIMIK